MNVGILNINILKNKFESLMAQSTSEFVKGCEFQHHKAQLYKSLNLMILSGVAIPRPRKPEVGKNLHLQAGWPRGEMEWSMTGPFHCPWFTELGKSQTAFAFDFICTVSLINLIGMRFICNTTPTSQPYSTYFHFYSRKNSFYKTNFPAKNNYKS